MSHTLSEIRHMKRLLAAAAAAAALALVPVSAMASGHGGGEEAPPVSSISYYDLAPEIVTNYSSQGHKVGYVRVRIQIMVPSPEELEVVTHHAPMIRDIVIKVLNNKTKEEIASPSGRDMIQTECKTQVELFMQQEEQRKVIKDLLFTNYIYQ